MTDDSVQIWADYKRMFATILVAVSHYRGNFDILVSYYSTVFFFTFGL